MTDTRFYDVMTATESAYMRDAYGEGAWARCVKLLLARGLTSEEAVAVLRSKHMRWADDAQGRGIGHETNSGAFRRYLGENPSLSTLAALRAEACDLVAMERED